MKLHLKNIAKAAKILVVGPAHAQKPQLPEKGGSPKKEQRSVSNVFGRAAEGLIKEAKIGPQLHADSLAALHRMTEMNSDLKKIVDEAYGYVVIPSAARAALLVGVTYGKGEVFERGQVIGYAGIVHITGGIQVGGGTAHILLILENQEALKCLKEGGSSFAANASLGIIKAGLTAIKRPLGLRIFMYPEGGEMIEAAIGVQTIKFRPAALGLTREAA